MWSWLPSWRRLTVIGLPLVVALTLGLLAANKFAGPLPPRHLVISTGRADGAYYQYALEYQRHLAKQGFRLEIAPGPGSVATLAQLTAGSVDAGFVQGGTAVLDNVGTVSAVGSLFYEPLWVFYRKTLALASLAELRGRRVAVGETGSGTREIALRLLADNDVTSQNARFVELPIADAVTALVAGEVDAALFVVSARADLVRRLLGNGDIELMSERRHLAYAARYPFVAPLRIVEGMLDIARNLPREEKVVVGVTAALAVRGDIHPDLVRVLFAAAQAVHRRGGLLERPGQFPSAVNLDLPLHDEAKRYIEHGPSWLERHVPLWLAGIFTRLLLVIIPVATLLLPVFGLVLPRIVEAHQRARLHRRYVAMRECMVPDEGASPEMVDEAIARLRRLRRQLLANADVAPNDFGDLFHLAMHLDTVLDRLEERRTAANRFV